MRSKASLPPPSRASDWSSLPRSSRVLKMPRAGGQVPTQTEAPASASALAMAKPSPAASATPAPSARLPVRSMLSMRGCFRHRGGGVKRRTRSLRARVRPQDPQVLGLGGQVSQGALDRAVRPVPDEVEVERVLPRAPLDRARFDLGEVDALLGERRQRPVEGTRAVADPEHDAGLALAAARHDGPRPVGADEEEEPGEVLRVALDAG